MAELLQIEEPGPQKRPAPQWAAFLELGFRPLYLAGCSWAALSVALWVFAPGLLRGQLGGVFWHAHEMLWGFIATIAVGFLLTAASNWTGITPLKGWALGLLSALWLLARGAYLVVFKLRNTQLRGFTAALTAGISGIVVMAYANEILGQIPTGAILYMSMGFIFLAPRFDRELARKEILDRAMSAQRPHARENYE